MTGSVHTAHQGPDVDLSASAVLEVHQLEQEYRSVVAIRDHTVARVEVRARCARRALWGSAVARSFWNLCFYVCVRL